MNDPSKILLTGATGYVGGKLLPALLARGLDVRCLVRDASRLQTTAAEVVEGDIRDRASLERALAGVSTAYYLVHSMGDADDFEEQERRSAELFSTVAREQGVQRIVYLGGLGSGRALSKHLRSRQAVGRIFAESGVPTIEFRASIILGTGSLSFELISALVERLPLMIAPRWVRTVTQPIGIRDVIAYLIGALDRPEGRSELVEIGGPDRASYGELMLEYARQRKLRRFIVPVPVLSPRLSSLWLGLITPYQASIGRELVDSLRNQTVVESSNAARQYPVEPVGFREAIRRTLAAEEQRVTQQRWTKTLERPQPQELRMAVDGRHIVESRFRTVDASPEAAFAVVAAIGGRNGWYSSRALWGLRSLIDRMVGGPGCSRGRRDPLALEVGEELDFWRVEAFEPGKLLRLRAEMKLPGKGWLQFEVVPTHSGSCLRQTAIFQPRGLFGRLYWYCLLPLHNPLFRTMLKRMGRAAETSELDPAGATA